MKMLKEGRGDGWRVMRKNDTSSPMDRNQMTNWILDRIDITANEKLVLVTMSTYGYQGEEIYPGVDTLAVRLRVTQRSIKRWLKGLREKGYLEIVGKYGRVDKYRIVFYPATPTSDTSHSDHTPTTNGHYPDLEPTNGPDYEKGLGPLEPPPDGPGYAKFQERFNKLVRQKSMQKNRSVEM